MPSRVIITAPCHPWLIEKLSKSYAVDFRPDITYIQLLELIGDAEGLVVTTRIKVDAALLARAKGLRWIGRLGSGLELIDTEAAAAKGIQVFSSPEGNRNAVAEQALGMLLGVLHNIPKSMREIGEGKWIRAANRGTELHGKTVGIIGFGNTGSQFAKLLQPFGVTVLAYDNGKSGFASGYIREAQPEQIQRYADIISFHVPLNEESRHMCNLNFMAACRQKPVILNTSRGKVVKEADLVTALQQGHISAACLDVLENEKLDTYTPEELSRLQWLLAQPNVIITPHIAGYTHEAYLGMAEVLYRKLSTTGATL